MKPTVLVVDDDFAIRELIELSLVPDYDVIKVEDGIKALQHIAKKKPDLIILDIMMPTLDGYEVCELLKHDEKAKKIPVIMLTAKHQKEDLAEAIHVEANEFITKPFEPDLLKKSVDKYFSEEKRSWKATLQRIGQSIHYIKEKKKPEERQVHFGKEGF